MCFLAASDKPEKYPIILPFLALRIYTGSMLTLYCYPTFWAGILFAMRLNNVRTFDSLKNSSFRIYYLSMIGQWAAQANPERGARPAAIPADRLDRTAGNNGTGQRYSAGTSGTVYRGSGRPFFQKAHDADRPGGHSVNIPGHRHFPADRLSE